MLLADPPLSTRRHKLEKDEEESSERPPKLPAIVDPLDSLTFNLASGTRGTALAAIILLSPRPWGARSHILSRASCCVHAIF